MKVADVMSKKVEHVTKRHTVKDVCRLIFGRGINGVPVVDNKKVVGFITEKDVIARFYPSIQEYIEDPVNTADFETMEGKASEVFRLPAEKIMSKDPVTVSPNTPLLRAQSLMFVHKVGRLPVIDENGNLVGILSKGDIFRSIVGGKIPFQEEEEFYNWLARDYDKLNDWGKRLKGEVPGISKLFKKAGTKKVLDVAFSTGEHSIALARNGFDVQGVDTSPTMHKISEAKKERLPKNIRDRIQFFTGNYDETLTNLAYGFDAAIFMGNALPHVLYTDKDILKNVTKLLKPKNSIMVFQVINFEKILKVNSGFRDYKLLKSDNPSAEEQIYFGFYTKEKGNILTITRTVFEHELGKWVFRRINSTQMLHMGKREISEVLKKFGFRKLSFYGSRFGEDIFESEFKPLESDWLIVVAKR